MPDYHRDGHDWAEEEFPLDCWLLEHSQIFDADSYRAAADIGPETNVAAHYLREGWKHGIEPGPGFNGRFLSPYYHSVGFFGPPALTYVKLLGGRGTMRATPEDAEPLAATIRASDLFDGATYAARVGNLDGLDPALHYVLVGEPMGFEPCSAFDPTYYLERYPDLAQVPNRFAHYLLSGHADGRRPLSVASQLTLDGSRIDPNRETVLLVVHEATRTGAPILAYNLATRLARERNVIALLLKGGELLSLFRHSGASVAGPLETNDLHPVEADYLVRRLSQSHAIDYAIANSIATRALLRPLTLAQIPVLALVHEFSSYVPPRGEMGRALEWATQIVFSAEVTAAAARADYPNIVNRPVHIVRQGRPDLPMREGTETAREQSEIRAAMRPADDAGAFVVLGCGTIDIRKGCDLFLSCASAVAGLKPRRPVRFVWIGSSPSGEMYRIYKSFLDEQILRAGLNDMVVMLDEVSNLDQAYELADMFFMCSRLDPLPNVAIEAALRGLPVICFDQATGIAEVLRTDKVSASSVVPYLDVQPAARLIANWADDREAYTRVSEATRRVAEDAFDMDRYARHLDRLGHEAMELMRQRQADFETIRTDSLFELGLSAGRDPTIRSRDEAIRNFLARAAAFGIGRQFTTNFYYRRPCPGFHPQIYEHENQGRYARGLVNALASFIRSGKPAGPWSHPVIGPTDQFDTGVDTSGLRVALHGHFYYPELAFDLMRKLAVNRLHCDLLLSTDSEAKAAFLTRATHPYDRGQVIVRICPNRGRDVSAFLTLFGPEILGKYDIVGHVHGKRSLFLDDAMIGETWREFLWQNLLGELHPMADIVISSFRADRRVGLVFPDEPHLPDWDLNREIAAGLAQRMGITNPLPPFFDFPVGTMFWARTEALRPLFDLGLSWDDYPPEPLPSDGTILHAIERLLPFVVGHAGYTYTTTHIPGTTW